MDAPDGGRLVVIFSLGGLLLQRHLRGGAVRCQPGFLPLDGSPQVTLDPFPARHGQGVVEDGWVRLVDDNEERARRRRPPSGLRWDDLDLLAFAATTLWLWLGLPLALDDPALGVREVSAATDGMRRLEVELPAGWGNAGTHVLHVDQDRRVHRHDDGDLVHELTGHCDFGGAELATVRRTRTRRGHATVAWADLVAAHVLPASPTGTKSVN